MLRNGLPWSGHRSETLTSILFHGRVTPFRGCTPSPLTSALITTTITNDGGLEVIQRCIFNQNNGNAADRPAYSIGHAAKFRSIPFISCGEAQDKFAKGESFGRTSVPGCPRY